MKLRSLLAILSVFIITFIFELDCGGRYISTINDAAFDSMEKGDSEESDGITEHESASEPIVVMTFNILCSFCNLNDYDPWVDRLNYFKDIFERYNPDLIGVQELFNAKEVDEFLSILKGYSALYFHDRKHRLLEDYPDATIFYRTDMFEILKKGVYWLSPTPDVPWSSGFAEGSQLWRLVVWAHMKQKASGREFYFMTTHFDNNYPSQKKSAPLVLERTEPWAEKMPVIITGDFNSQPDDEAYKILVEGIAGKNFKLINSFDIAKEWHIETNQDPVPDFNVDGRIDHVFVGGPAFWICEHWIVDMHIYGEKKRYPSDHFAISVKINFDSSD